MAGVTKTITSTKVAGNILNIKPIISVKDGELYPHSKVRGRKKAIEEIINLIIKNTETQRHV